MLDSSIPQYFEPDPAGKNRYIPFVAAAVEIKYHDQRRGIDIKHEKTYTLNIDGIEDPDWEESTKEDIDFRHWPSAAPSGASFRALPSFVTEDRGLKKTAAKLKDYLYQEAHLELYRNKKLRMESKPGESETDFNIRVQDTIEEMKEEALEKFKERYEKKEQQLLTRLQRAQERVEKEKADQTSSLIGAGASILGALFGRTTAAKIGTAVSRGSRVLKERSDLSRAQQRVAEVQERIENMEDELSDKIDELSEKYCTENYPNEIFTIRPKKSDIEVEKIAIAWRPEI